MRREAPGAVPLRIRVLVASVPAVADVAPRPRITREVPAPRAAPELHGVEAALFTPYFGPRQEVLGVAADIGDDDLRRQWKALVRENHPDKLIAEGLPEEFVAAATERLARINAAYDVMARARGLAGS